MLRLRSSNDLFVDGDAASGCSVEVGSSSKRARTDFVGLSLAGS